MNKFKQIVNKAEPNKSIPLVEKPSETRKASEGANQSTVITVPKKQDEKRDESGND